MGVKVVKRDALAKEWGISVNTIDNMLQRGLLRKVGRGLIDHDHAMKVRASQDPIEIERAAIIKAQRATATASGNSPLAMDAAPLMRARTAKVITDARRSELELKHLSSTLIEAASVKREAGEARRRLILLLRAFPARLGAIIAPVTDAAECVKIIEAEVVLLVGELQDAVATMEVK